MSFNNILKSSLGHQPGMVMVGTELIGLLRWQ